MKIRAVLMDFGETLVERISDQFAPLSQLALKPFPDSASALRQLREAGYLLGIVSNTEQSGEQEMERALEIIGLRDYFDVVVTSLTAGFRKPDPAIFAQALDRLRCSPRESVMVGDDLTTDIQGAAALGMATIRVLREAQAARAGKVHPRFTVSSLLDVPAILEHLQAAAPTSAPGA